MVACWTVSLNWVSSTLKLSECLCTKAPHDEDWICPFLIVSWDVDIASPRQNSPFLSIQKLSKLLFDPNSIWLPFTVRLVIQTPFVPVDCNWNSVSALTASEERQYWKLLNLLFIMSFRSPSTLKKISLPSQFLADISFQIIVYTHVIWQYHIGEIKLIDHFENQPRYGLRLLHMSLSLDVTTMQYGSGSSFDKPKKFI